MKSKVFFVALLAAALGLSTPGLSLARGGMGGGNGMGGGFSASNGMGGGFGGGNGMGGDRSGFDAPHQGMSGPVGQADRQQDRNMDQTRQQDRSQSRDQLRNQDGTSTTGVPGARNGAQGSDNGHHYGQQDDGNPGQGETHRATPAQPGAPGQPATPAGN